MADWKTYAKAARNTARRQVQNASRSAQDRPRSDRDRPRRDGTERPRRDDRDRPRRDDAQRPRQARPDEPRRDRTDRSRGGSTGSRTLSTGDYARAARRALDEGTRESRDSLRRSGARARKDAAAYAAVAERRMRKAQLGRRVTAAFRDALLMGLSLFVIWFVVTRTGVQIPFTAVLVVVGVIVAVRFGWALFAQFAPRSQEAEEEELREYDPSLDQQDEPLPTRADHDPSR